MLRYQDIPIAFSKGLNLKQNEKQTSPGDLIELENGIFSQPGTIQKRKGGAKLNRSVTPAGSITDGRAMGVRGGDELVVIGNTTGLTGPKTPRVFSRSTGAAKWAEIGTHTPVEVSVETVSQPYSFHSMPNVCVVDNKYAIYAGERRAGLLSAQAVEAHATIRDIATGAKLWEGELVAVQENTPKPLAIGTKAVILVADDGGPNVRRWTWDSTTPGTAPVDGGTIVTDVENTELWDACEIDSSACVIARATTAGDIKVLAFDSTGATVATATIVGVAVGSVAVFKVSNATTDYICVAWSIAGNDVRFSLRNISTLVQVTAPGVAFAAGGVVRNITGARETESTSPTGEWIRLFADIGDRVVSGQVTFSGIGSVSEQTFYHHQLASKAFYANGRANVLCTHGASSGDNLQPTYFLRAVDASMLTADVPVTLAKALYARGAYGDAYRRTVGAGSAGGLPQAVSLGNNKWLTAGIKQERLIRTNAGSFVAPETTKSLCGITFDMLPRAPHGEDAAGALFVGGGYVGHCDGRFQEHGFHLSPYFTGASSATAGSLIAATAYDYIVVAEWPNRKGDIERSSPSASVAVTTGAAQTSVDLVINTLANVAGWTDAALKCKQTLFHVYRKLSTETVYHDTGVSVANTTSALTVTVNEGTLAATIADNAVLYTDGGVLENIGPPPMDSFATGGNRMAGIPADDPTAWWYTKEKEAGIAYEWSDLLTVRIETHGPGVATCFYDDKWFIFKERAIYVISGQGANSLGQGNWNTPYLVSGNIGCVDRASVLVTNIGVFFKSQKGIYLLGDGLKYVGAAVESFNSEAIVGAVLEADSHRAIFFTDAGSALVFDYETGQWGTYTGHEAVAAAVWQDRLTFLDDEGRVYQQNDEYLDDGQPYTLKVGLGWIDMALPLGWKRFRSIGLLAEWKSPHTLIARVFYRKGEVPDGEGTVVGNTVRYDIPFEAESVDGQYMLRAKLPHQKVTGIRFTIEDTDGTGEDYSISAVTLSVGVKRGIHLPASKTA